MGTCATIKPRQHWPRWHCEVDGMTKTTIKRSIAIDALASLALDRLARHRGKSRHEVLADLIAEASRLTTKDMSTAEWKDYYGKPTPGNALASRTG